MLAERSQHSLLSSPERVIEEFYCRVLNAHPALIPSPFASTAAANDSLAWAIETAREIAARNPSGKIRYRGMRHDLWLGRSLPAAAAHHMQLDAANMSDAPPKSQRAAQLSRRPEVRKKSEDEDDAVQGMWMLQMDDPQQHVEDPAGMQRPTDRDDNADAGDIADSLSELPEACLISTPTPAWNCAFGESGCSASSATPDSPAGGIRIPWEFSHSRLAGAGCYRTSPCVAAWRPAGSNPCRRARMLHRSVAA